MILVARGYDYQLAQTVRTIPPIGTKSIASPENFYRAIRKFGDVFAMSDAAFRCSCANSYRPVAGRVGRHQSAY
jgi:hypothetical protein